MTPLLSHTSPHRKTHTHTYTHAFQKKENAPFPFLLVSGAFGFSSSSGVCEQREAGTFNKQNKIQEGSERAKEMNRIISKGKLPLKKSEGSAHQKKRIGANLFFWDVCVRGGVMGAHAFIFSYACVCHHPISTHQQKCFRPSGYSKRQKCTSNRMPLGPLFAGRWVAVKRMAVIVVRVALTKRI